MRRAAAPTRRRAPIHEARTPSNGIIALPAGLKPSPSRVPFLSPPGNDRAREHIARLSIVVNATTSCDNASGPHHVQEPRPQEPGLGGAADGVRDPDRESRDCPRRSEASPARLARRALSAGEGRGWEAAHARARAPRRAIAEQPHAPPRPAGGRTAPRPRRHPPRPPRLPLRHHPLRTRPPENNAAPLP